MDLLNTAGLFPTIQMVFYIPALLLISGYILYYAASEVDSRSIRQVAMSLWVLSFSFTILSFMNLALNIS